MKIIDPSVEIMNLQNGKDVARLIEKCGRVCYKSERNIKKDSAEKFVKNLISRGHESVLEHAYATLKFTCDRAVSHEIVRHRIASYSQESTRYCNYSKDSFGKEITVIRPLFFEQGSKPYEAWKLLCETAETSYFDLLDMGCTPQEARTVLPNSLKTEIVMSANMREWRHFFSLRCEESSHTQMRQIAKIALSIMHNEIAAVFDDLWEEYGKNER